MVLSHLGEVGEQSQKLLHYGRFFLNPLKSLQCSFIPSSSLAVRGNIARMSQERGESPNILHSNASQRDPLRGRPSRGNYSVTGKDTYGAQAEEWANVEDPNERRKIQNKLAQRRFSKSDKKNQGSLQDMAKLYQEIKLRSKGTKQSVKRKIDRGLAPHMPLQNLMLLTPVGTCPGCLGVVYQ